MLLNRYRRSACEAAARIGSLVRSPTRAADRVKERAETTPSYDGGDVIQSSGFWEFQHAPQPTAQASRGGAVRRNLVSVAPAVWSAHSVQSAVCSLKTRPQPQLRSHHLPPPTVLPYDDGAASRKLVSIAPLHLRATSGSC